MYTHESSRSVCHDDAEGDREGYMRTGLEGWGKGGQGWRGGVYEDRDGGEG